MFPILLLIIILAENFFVTSPPYVEAKTLPHVGVQGFQLLHSDENRVVLELNTPEYEILADQKAGGESITVSGPDRGTTNKAGYPQLPAYSTLIGVPANANIEIFILSDEVESIEGEYRIAPVPEPAPSTSPNPDVPRPGELTYEYAPEAYSHNILYPDAPANISEDAWFREQRVVRLDVFPFQYNPVTGKLLWHQSLTIEVRFVGGDQQACSTECLDGESVFEALFQQKIINYDTARQWRSKPQGNPSRMVADYTPLGPRFEIVVGSDAIYQLSYDDLSAAGMDMNNVDPRNLAMFSQGQNVAIFVAGENDGSFDPEDYILFYGEVFRGDILAQRYAGNMTNGNNPANNWLWYCEPTCELEGMLEQYTDDNVYWLLESDFPGLRMSEIDGTPHDTAPVPDHYFRTIHEEESARFWSFEFASEDGWFWDVLQQINVTSTYTATLTSLAAGPFTATVRAEMASYASSNGYPDHHTRFTINSEGTPVDDAYWDGRARYGFEADIPQTWLLEGNNHLHYKLVDDGAVFGAFMLFDYFEITYARQFIAENNWIAFSRNEPGTWQYETEGFASNAVEVLDIQNPFEPGRIVNSAVSGSGSYTVAFEVAESGEARYALTGEFASPDAITLYTPPDFISMPEAEYIIISHVDFMGSIQALADYRTAAGVNTMVVNIEDIYNEFNDGILHPIAIKNFLAFTFDNWQTPPTYVLLVGDGHWNFKGYAPERYGDAPVYMPPNLAYVDPWQGEVDSANLLATIVGDDTMPDLAIGRLPVASSSEADAFVSKVIAYEQTEYQNWQRNIVFVADNIPDDSGDFVELSDNIINNYVEPAPLFQAERIYLNTYGCSGAGQPECENVSYAITNTLNTTGTLILNYIGHGSAERWTHEVVLHLDDLPTIQNASQLPVILSMTCLDGYWILPNKNDMATEMIVKSDGGAIGTFSPTGLGVATGHDALHEGFYDTIFNVGMWDLGSATLGSKLELFGSGSHPDLMHTFTLFGDPALQILSPYGLELTPVSQQAAATSGSTVTYTLQLENTGLLTDSFTLEGGGAAWDTAYTPSVINDLLPGENATITVTVDISSTALGNEVDTYNLTVISQSDLHERANATLTTIALTDGLIVSPPSQESSGAPGTVLSFTVQVTNTSVSQDTFTVTLASSNWQVGPFSETLGPIPPVQSDTIVVDVYIPNDALGYDTDTAMLQITSQLDPAHSAVASMTSQAITEGLIVSPSAQQGEGVSGTSVQYTVWVTNTTNMLAYYDVAFSGYNWVTLGPGLVGPVQPGASTAIIVTVDIPEGTASGETDTATIAINPHNDEPNVRYSTLTTIAQAPPQSFIYLPAILR